MQNSTLIIITGLPATGKTTLGQKLAEELKLPFLSRDHIKETLFDSLGYKDREWSKQIGASSFTLLYYITETLLKAGKSVIIETNFNPKFANQKFHHLQHKYKFTPIQIRCITNGKILFDRFTKRSNSQERHPGHVDNKNLEELKPILLKGKIEKLDLKGPFFDINTSDFKKINLAHLINSIKLHNH